MMYTLKGSYVVLMVSAINFKISFKSDFLNLDVSISVRDRINSGFHLLIISVAEFVILLGWESEKADDLFTHFHTESDPIVFQDCFPIVTTRDAHIKCIDR